MKAFIITLLVIIASPVSMAKKQDCKKVFKEHCKHNMAYDCFLLNAHKFSEECQDKIELNGTLAGNEEGCRFQHNRLCNSGNSGMKYEDCIISNKKTLSALCIRALINERKKQRKLSKDCKVLYTKFCPFTLKRGDKVDFNEFGLSYAKCVEKNKKKLPKDCKDGLKDLSEGYGPLEDPPAGK